MPEKQTTDISFHFGRISLSRHSAWQTAPGCSSFFPLSYLFSANETSLICSGMPGEWAIWLATRNLMMYIKCVRTALFFSPFFAFLVTKCTCWRAFQAGFNLKLGVMNHFHTATSFCQSNSLLFVRIFFPPLVKLQGHAQAQRRWCN